MKIVILLFAVFLFKSTYAADCSVCNLGMYFNETQGYRCYTLNSNDVMCTCPGNAYEINRECRLCNRPDPTKNVCQSSVNLEMCLENDDCGTSYACLCKSPTGGAVLTTNANCDTSRPLICPGAGGPGPGTGPSPCLNGGVYINNICHCPAGYGGSFCQDINNNGCERVTCKNNGRCAIQRPSGPPEPVCQCPYGTWGEYCELIGTLGFCSSGSCMNNGACQENVIGSTRFAYCRCQPGYSGPKCDKRDLTCTSEGVFRDENMHEQGKYFECKTVSGGTYRLEQKSCPKGLRFDLTLKLCKL